MRYIQPQITNAVNAAATIQGAKAMPPGENSDVQPSIVAAYPADE
jgi:hypothetical protein